MKENLIFAELSPLGQLLKNNNNIDQYYIRTTHARIKMQKNYNIKKVFFHKSKVFLWIIVKFVLTVVSAG